MNPIKFEPVIQSKVEVKVNVSEKNTCEILVEDFVYFLGTCFCVTPL